MPMKHGGRLASRAFAGIIPDQLHKLRPRLGRNRRVDHHDVWRNRNQCHGEGNAIKSPIWKPDRMGLHE